MNWTLYFKFLLAIAVWREAQGEGPEGMRAVGHAIANEVRSTKLGWDGVIAKKWYVSSMTAPGDPNTTKWPNFGDHAFVQAMKLADGIYEGADPDNTEGAQHYFNPHIVLPSWARLMTKTVTIGNHDFYRDEGLRTT